MRPRRSRRAWQQTVGDGGPPTRGGGTPPLLSRLPYWLVAALLLAVFFLWSIVNNGDYRVIFDATVKGVGTTVYVSLIAFLLAIALGLLMGLMRVARQRILREAATFYVEIMRGIPMLVILYYIAFVGAPALVAARNWLAAPLIKLEILNVLNVRQVDFTARAVMALMLGYGAFISEIFRAGIESIGRGQMEAAQSLGMTYAQSMRYVILPQAVRNVLPPLGNEFIAMLKDSALVSALGVQDITQLGKVYSASTFRFFETYNVVAFLYLVMTLGLSLLVRALERKLKRHK
ncbi:MAG TPA: amino acid ABC transporter permease [Anaerolineae bacterium]|nr:amino acid ABC transporter permease [Anaerolineae bacterium]